jgi:hypothetical protein
MKVPWGGLEEMAWESLADVCYVGIFSAVGGDNIDRDCFADL